MEELKRCFYEFGLKIPFYGVIVACGDDPLVREVFAEFPKKVVFYGFNETNDYIVKGKAGEYTVSVNGGESLGALQLKVPGVHNALNALGAVVASYFAGVPMADALRGVGLYEGVDRRFQYRGLYQNAMVYDDYGHHPTEVKATLQAFKEKFPEKNICVLFQPHRYSRTESCWEDFMSSFSDAHTVLLLDIYAAGEKARDDIKSSEFACQLKSKNGVYVGDFSRAEEYLQKNIDQCDILVCLGAGDVNKFYNHLTTQK